MPELLEGLEQLARERGASLQRASRELAGEPEGFLIVAREVCAFVGFLSDFWNAVRILLRKGGVPARELVRVCDMLLGTADEPARHLQLVVKVWRERELPAEMAEPIYADVLSARARLDALIEEIRKVRERAAVPPRLAADPAELAGRIRQADEAGEWVKLADAVSRMRQPGTPKQE